MSQPKTATAIDPKRLIHVTGGWASPVGNQKTKWSWGGWGGWK